MTFLGLLSGKNITIIGSFFHFILCHIIPLFQMDLIPWTFMLYVIYGLFYESCGTLIFTSVIL